MVKTLPAGTVTVTPSDKGRAEHSVSGATIMANVVNIASHWHFQKWELTVSAKDKNGYRRVSTTYYSTRQITVDVNSLPWTSEIVSVNYWTLTATLQEDEKHTITITTIRSPTYQDVVVTGGGSQTGYVGDQLKFTVKCTINDPNIEFLYWEVDGEPNSQYQTYTFYKTVGNQDKNYNATAYTQFNEPKHSVTVVTSADGHGTTSPTSETQSGYVGAYTTFHLVATPDDGYEFVNWTLGSSEYSTEASTSFTTTVGETSKTYSFVAHFKGKTHSVTVKTTAHIDSTSTAGYTSPQSETKTGNVGDELTFDLTTWRPNSNPNGYHWLGWFLDGALYSDQINVNFKTTVKDKDEEYSFVAAYRSLNGQIVCNSNGVILYARDMVMADYYIV